MWKSKLMKLLMETKYQSLRDGSERGFMPHHIDAIMNTVVPFVESNFGTRPKETILKPAKKTVRPEWVAGPTLKDDI